jgi:hypothetical protein
MTVETASVANFAGLELSCWFESRPSELAARAHSLRIVAYALNPCISPAIEFIAGSTIVADHSDAVAACQSGLGVLPGATNIS